MLNYKRIVSVVAILSLVTTNFISFAQASSLTSASDKLSDSDMLAMATHTVKFTINQSLATNDYVEITVPAAFGTTTSGNLNCGATSTPSTPGNTNIYRLLLPH